MTPKLTETGRGAADVKPRSLDDQRTSFDEPDAASADPINSIPVSRFDEAYPPGRRGTSTVRSLRSPASRTQVWSPAGCSTSAAGPVRTRCSSPAFDSR